MADKGKLLQLVIEKAEKEKVRIEATLESIREEAIGAPDSRQSHSDTTRFQINSIRGKLRENAERYRTIVKALETFTFPAKIAPRVSIGSLVELADENGGVRVLLILPEGNSISVKDGDVMVTVLTPTAPLGSALMGKRQGDTIEFPPHSPTRFTIVGVK